MKAKRIPKIGEVVISREPMRLKTLETQSLNTLQLVRGIERRVEEIHAWLVKMPAPDSNVAIVELSKRLDSVIRTIAGHVSRVDQTIRAEVEGANNQFNHFAVRVSTLEKKLRELEKLPERVDELFKINISQHNRISAVERRKRK